MQERTIADLQTQIADGVRAKFLDGAAADARRDKLGMLLQEENVLDWIFSVTVGGKWTNNGTEEEDHQCCWIECPPDD